LENICEKDYAAFMEETLQRMVQLPVSGICILIKLEDGSVCSDYYNSAVIVCVRFFLPVSGCSSIR
jgi:hypothetical protein